MGIEQDIRQTKFVNAKQKAMINLLYSYGWIMEQVKSFLASEDITHQQFNILRILRGANGPLSTLQIRERMLDKMSDTSRIVDRLVAKELVQKVTCAKDKRLVDVTISAKGLALLQKLDKRDDHIQQIMKNISEAEATQLSGLLDKIRG
ncbi:MAG: MarR family transcriptional regulator [Chitinophagaceae bacterium]|nr:MAG: MarR family transcriptional regulator [Chitinophagaceae bacterium]